MINYNPYEFSSEHFIYLQAQKPTKSSSLNLRKMKKMLKKKIEKKIAGIETKLPK